MLRDRKECLATLHGGQTCFALEIYYRVNPGRMKEIEEEANVLAEQLSAL